MIPTKHLFVTVIFLVMNSGLLAGDGFINKAAKAPLAGVENMHDYIQARNDRIQAELAAIRKSKKFPRGIKLEKDGALSVELEQHPQLDQIESMMRIFSNGYETGHDRAKMQDDLHHRGLTVDDMAALDQYILRHDGHENTIKVLVEERLKADGLSHLSLFDSATFLDAKDKDIISFIMRKDAYYLAAEQDWAVQMFDNLTIPGRRILLFYLFEKYSHGSAFYRDPQPVTSVSDQELLNFKNAMRDFHQSQANQN